MHQCTTLSPLTLCAARLWLLAGLAAAPLEAWAYLDPGTGSMLLSIVVGLASSGYFFIRRLPTLIRQFVFRMRGEGKELSGKRIVIYAESAAYWGTFEPVLRALASSGERVTYFTSDEKDPVFTAGFSHVDAHYIGKGNSAYTSLGFLEADLFVLTTPGIDVLQIRRSKGVKRYVHLVHAATDIHGYKLYSFDYYDAVFCSGSHQVASLRTLEEKRRTEPKDLRIVGCAYFDRMVAQKKECAVAPDPKTVLIAPTWGRAGLLTKTGAAIPKRLAEVGYHVILRPHPQSFVSELPLMESLQKELAGYDNIEWDRNPNGFASLSRAGVMVSDFSGVVFDFAFVFERPVVSIGDGWQKDGYEAWDLPNPAWEMGVLDEIGIHLATGEESKAAEAVEALLKEGDARIERIRRVREAGIKNFGAAGEPIAQALLSLLAEVNAPESQAARPAARVAGKEE